MTKKKIKKTNKLQGDTMLYNRFAVVLDRSGSMCVIKNRTIEAFNSTLKAIRDGAAEKNQAATVTLVQFSDNFDVLYKDRLAHSAEELDDFTYRTGGQTAMFDAVGEAASLLAALPGAEDPNVSNVVLVVTDGCENASRRFTTTSLKALFQKYQATDRWTFAFSLPPGYKRDFCSNFGIPEGNVQEWEATEAGTTRRAEATKKGLFTYYTARSVGRKSTKGFFQTDMSSVTTSSVKKQLTDIKTRCKVWSVGGETDIKSFVETNGQSYRLGKGYYQLTKDEKIQPQKQILLMEKGKGPVYGGFEARDVLGLPPDLEVKVRPGNHANWDIFIQSTSTNRKLVRGTKFIYMMQ